MLVGGAFYVCSPSISAVKAKRKTIIFGLSGRLARQGWRRGGGDLNMAIGDMGGGAKRQFKRKGFAIPAMPDHLQFQATRPNTAGILRASAVLQQFYRFDNGAVRISALAKANILRAGQYRRWRAAFGGRGGGLAGGAAGNQQGQGHDRDPWQGAGRFHHLRHHRSIAMNAA